MRAGRFDVRAHTASTINLEGHMLTPRTVPNMSADLFDAVGGRRRTDARYAVAFLTPEATIMYAFDTPEDRDELAADMIAIATRITDVQTFALV